MEGPPSLNASIVDIISFVLLFILLNINEFVVLSVFLPFYFFQNSHLSIEEFHSKLQEATNFPLRPFVIPFLKVNMSILPFQTE